MLITISKDRLNLSSGDEIILRHQNWDDYEHLLKIREEKVLPKIYFNGKKQEIRLMSPLPGHGKIIDTLRDLIKILLRNQGQDWDAFDPITLKQVEQAGVEPDTCFYISNRQAILGKEKIDLTVDPPPDLAVEVDLTSTTQVEDYLPIAIPELWIYRQGKLLIYLLNNGEYHERDQSLIFQDFDVKTILPQYVEMAWEKGSSIALKEFEQDLE